MDKKEMQMIVDLMEELQGEMEPSESDFEERLGRKKPDVKVMKIEGVIPKHEMSESPEFERGEEEGMMEDESPLEKTDDDEEMRGSEFEEDMSPEEKLKARIMRMRGE